MIEVRIKEFSIMTIKFQGQEFTLVGTQLKVGDTAPEFKLTNNDLGEVTLKDMSGKKVFLVVPSLDTPVCDMEVRKFNEQATSLNNTTIYVVSADLPFAQGRWCGTLGAKNVVTLSDYKDRSFGENYGTLIKELALQTRAVIILDKNNKVIYTEYLSEITNEPNYDAALNTLRK